MQNSCPLLLPSTQNAKEMKKKVINLHINITNSISRAKKL